MPGVDSKSVRKPNPEVTVHGFIKPSSMSMGNVRIN